MRRSSRSNWGQSEQQQQQQQQQGGEKKNRAVPRHWTEEEHERFLLGLKQFGKGRQGYGLISENFVPTRTPAQVETHANLYLNNKLKKQGVESKRNDQRWLTSTTTETTTTTTTTTTATATSSKSSSGRGHSHNKWSECEKCQGRMKREECAHLGYCKKCQVEYDKNTHCFICGDFYNRSSNSVPWVSCPYCEKWFHYDCCTKDDQEVLDYCSKNTVHKMIDYPEWQCEECKNVRQNKKRFGGKTVRQVIETTSQYMDLLQDPATTGSRDREKFCYESLPGDMGRSKKMVEDELHRFGFTDVREVPWKWEICAQPFQKPTAKEMTMIEKIGMGIKLLFLKPKRRWYQGTVTNYNFRTKKHRVAFDDGDVQQISLGPYDNQSESEQFQLLGRKSLQSLQEEKKGKERKAEKMKKVMKLASMSMPPPSPSGTTPVKAERRTFEQEEQQQGNNDNKRKRLAKNNGRRSAARQTMESSPDRTWNVDSKKKRTVMKLNSETNHSNRMRRALVRPVAATYGTGGGVNSTTGQRQRQGRGQNATTSSKPAATVMSQVQQAAAQLQTLLSQLNGSGELNVDEAKGDLEHALEGIGVEYDRLLTAKESEEEEEKRRRRQSQAQQGKIRPSRSNANASNKSQIYLKTLEKKLASADIRGRYQDARDTCLHLYGLRLFQFQKQDGDWQVIPTVVKSLQKHPLDQVQRAVAKLLKVSPGLKDAVRNVPEEKWLRYIGIRDEGRDFVYDHYDKNVKFMELQMEENADDDTATDLKVRLEFT